MGEYHQVPLLQMPTIPAMGEFPNHHRLEAHQGELPTAHTAAVLQRRTHTASPAVPRAQAAAGQHHLENRACVRIHTALGTRSPCTASSLPPPPSLDILPHEYRGLQPHEPDKTYQCN